MCVDFHAYLSGVTHMRQEFTVCQIKSHFSIMCGFYLFSQHLITTLKEDYKIKEDWEQSWYLGITLNWDYKKQKVHLSMPG